MYVCSFVDLSIIVGTGVAPAGEWMVTWYNDLVSSLNLKITEEDKSLKD